MISRKMRIGVMGAGQCSKEIYSLAEQVGQLIALLVDLPVIRVPPQHDDVIRAVLNRHPRAHHREVHEIRRETREGTGFACHLLG